MNHSSEPNNFVVATPTTKIKIIEDEEATGETAQAYDFLARWIGT